ncbi:hypothetical protein [Lentzea tibetensis]|uniref:hypothetical protein n=1 Tax=Lentzea tibetensis TaxID=2591470 RepID=UPI001646FCEC|nr:hypothetical protein [Lentzea tibetensis]
MRTRGVVAAQVVEVRSHPNGERVWVAIVDHGQGETVQVVFGGPPFVKKNDLVPLAPPGAVLPGRKKMRRRRYRGEVSHGMFCSLAELGWDPYGPDEVVLLSDDLVPGQSLDDGDWRTYVREPCPLAQLIRRNHERARGTTAA